MQLVSVDEINSYYTDMLYSGHLYTKILAPLCTQIAHFHWLLVNMTLHCPILSTQYDPYVKWLMVKWLIHSNLGCDWSSGVLLVDHYTSTFAHSCNF